MNSPINLSLGGCTCVDEKGGCSFGDSCCSCDAGGPTNEWTNACPTGGGGGGGCGTGGGCGGTGGGCGTGGTGGGAEKKKRVPPNPRFCVEKVRKILKKVLLELLDHCYSNILNEGLSQKAVSCVRRQVKELKFDSRYKYICFITVAERSKHNLPLITRTYWDPDADAVACFSHRTCGSMAIIQCFGVLCENCSKS